MNKEYVTAKYKNCPRCDVYYLQDKSGNRHLVRKCKLCDNQMFQVEDGLQIRTELSKEALKKRQPTIFSDQKGLI